MDDTNPTTTNIPPVSTSAAAPVPAAVPYSSVAPAVASAPVPTPVIDTPVPSVVVPPSVPVAVAVPAVPAPLVPAIPVAAVSPVIHTVPVAPVVPAAAPPAVQPVPVPAAAVPPATSPSPVMAPSASSLKKVLIIEDERPLAHALELKITHEGYETHVSLTGADGLKEALSGVYSIILLDLIMPELDGFSLLEKLQENGVKSPVIVLSNLGQEEDKAKAKTLGAQDYFVKANTPIIDIVKRMKEVML
ncbi:MAG: winged helix family two component transcriptional regulator [Candidatus Peribacteria bacterium]|nr:winged helix family two component transcriptional regulator [Candidatus Peribacteria bacterium]